MKLNSVAVFLLFAMFRLGSCDNDPNKIHTNNVTPDCAEHCTAVARALKRNLSPEESASFGQAIAATHAGPNAHIHADVVGGKLVFTPEEKPDPKHLSTSTDPIYFTPDQGAPSSAPVRIILTPAAERSLDARINPN
jgi:hypothetical protein